MYGRRRGRRSYAVTDTTITSTSANLPPPTSGDYNYNGFTPPTLGNTYVDPVFGKTIRRVTDIGVRASEDPNYTFPIINCDGTLFLHDHAVNGVSMKSTTTGADVYAPGASVPMSSVNAEYMRWSHTDPSQYFFLDGDALKMRDLDAGTTTTIKTFPAALQKVGGSHEWADRTDRYWVVMYSNTVKVWDRTDDVIYSNPFTPLPGVDNNTTTISPDGNYVLTWASADSTPQKLHYSYALDHVGNSINATPKQWWGCGGSHAAVLTLSDGSNKVIIEENDSEGAVYACDITLDLAGLTAAQQRAAQTRLILNTSFDAYHFSGVQTAGALQNWVIVSVEPNSGDNFDGAVGAWRVWKSEIIAINALTGAVRRLCHHRSRNLQDRYYPQPKPSLNCTGTHMLFSSNMNLNQATADYSDLYLIANPLTSL